MGCSNSKNDDGLNIKNSFTNLPIKPLKDLFDVCKNFFTQWLEIVEPLEVSRRKFYGTCGFPQAVLKGVKVQHAFVAMVLFFSQSVKGDIAKLRFDFKEYLPYITLNIGTLSHELKQLYDDFREYARQLDSLLQDEFVLADEHASSLTSKVKGAIKENKPEFEKLGGMVKVAVTNCTNTNLATVTANCKSITTYVRKYTQEMEEMKDFIGTLNERVEILAEYGKKCYD